MNRYFIISLLLLLSFYVTSLNAMFETAFLFFILAVLSSIVAVIYEVDNKKRRSHLRVVK